jgi:hypothetical protein
MTQRITRLGFSRDCFAKQFIILEKELCDYSDICEFQKLNFLSVFLKQNKKKVAEIKAELSNFYSQHLSYVISVNKQNLKKLKNWRKQQKKQLKYYQLSLFCGNNRQKEFPYWSDEDIAAFIDLKKRMYKIQLRKQLQLCQKYREHYSFLTSYKAKLFSLAIFPL